MECNHGASLAGCVAATRRLTAPYQPLSTSLVWRDVVDEKAPEEMPHAPRRRNPFVPYLGLSPPRTLPPTIKVPEAMDIAVMINMPQAPEALEEDGILEYQIGMLQVPWKDESLLPKPT